MKLNQRKAGAILTYVQIILTNTISLIYTPFALRILGQSQYGLFGTASSFTSYLSLLSLGIGGAYIRWNAKYRAENDTEGEYRLNGLFFTIFSIITVVTLIVGIGLLFIAPYVFGKTFTDSELHDLLILIFLSVLSTALTFFMTPIFGCIQAYEKFLILKVVSIVSSVATPIINVFALCAGGKAVVLQIITLIISIITFIIYYLYAIKVIKMKFIFTGFKFKLIKEILVFSSFLIMNTIANLISDSTDSLIIAAVAGTTAVSVYTIGHNFQNYFSQLSVAVSSVFAPQINMLVAKENDNNVLTNLMLKIGRIQFYITSLVIIGFVFLGKQFIILWAGENYSDSYIIALLLMFASFIPLFQNVGLEIQKAKNKHKARTIVYFLVAFINIGLTIPFTIWWKGIGAVLATFICCVFGQAIFMNVYYHKSIGLDMIVFWKGILKIIPSFIPSILVGILFNTIFKVDNVIMFLVAVLSIVIVYIISIWFLSMNTEEKEIFSKPFIALKMKINNKKES